MLIKKNQPAKKEQENEEKAIAKRFQSAFQTRRKQIIGSHKDLLRIYHLSLTPKEVKDQI